MSFRNKEQGGAGWESFSGTGSRKRPSEGGAFFSDEFLTSLLDLKNLALGAQRLPKASPKPLQIMKKVMPERIPAPHRNSDTFFHIF